MSKNAPATVDTIPLLELRKRAAHIKKLTAEVRAALPGLVQQSDDERLHSEGRLRDGEEAALTAVLDTVDAAPQYFTVLADKDNGRDPERFETDVLRERLERRAILAELAAELAPLATELDDHILHLGALVRPPVLAAYHIAKPLAGHDAQIGSHLAVARSFYGAPARRAAETRKKKAPPKK
jgi:hypothetical protein